MATSANSGSPGDDINVYECEIRIKFRIIEERTAIDNQDTAKLFESLVDAYSYGDDSYLESLDFQVTAQEIQALEASPAMRRQLIRLRNSRPI